MVWVSYQEYHNLVPCVCPPGRTKGTSDLSPPQSLPLGIPIRIAVIESARGTMGRGKRRKMADNSSKNMNCKKSVKQNRNPIYTLLYYYLHNSVQKYPNSRLAQPKPQNRAQIRPENRTYGRGLSSLLPFPIVHRALSFSFFPASPQHKEASGEERDIILNGATWRRKAPENQKQLLLDLFFGSNSYPVMIYFSKWPICLKIFRQLPFLQWSLSHWQLIKVMLSSQKCWVFLSHNDT